MTTAPRDPLPALALSMAKPNCARASRSVLPSAVSATSSVNGSRVGVEIEPRLECRESRVVEQGLALEWREDSGALGDEAHEAAMLLLS